MRGIANVEITPELALELACAMGTYWRAGRVLVGGDARTSTPMLKAAVTAGLLAAGCRVDDAGVGPTPALQFAVREGGYDGGVVVTASHNPPEHNGLKGTDKGGMELSREQEDAIEALYFGRKSERSPWHDLRGVGAVHDANERYVQAIVARVDRERIRGAGLRVVMDCSNGAGALTGPFVARELGARLTTLNCQLDGTFPGHPSEPTPENLKDLQRMVVETGANLGVAQDGDADRAVFVDETGAFVPGERVLALFAGMAVRRAGGGVVCTPVSSSLCVEDLVRKHGGRVLYTAVGSPVVARAMVREKAVFGGEENGGLIFPEHQHVRDSAMAVAAMLELLATTGKPLSSLLAEVPRYHTVKRKIEVPNERKADLLRDFTKSRIAQRGKVDTTDGVKVTLEKGWILVRPSGTEPLFRVYAEAKELGAAEALAGEALEELKRMAGAS